MVTEIKDNTIISHQAKTYRLWCCRFTEQEAVIVREKIPEINHPIVKHDMFNGRDVWRVYVEVKHD